MKENFSIWMLSAAAMLFFSGALLAQEKVEVSVRVKEGGKVVRDTTYLFDDAEDAMHAMKMMQVMSGDNEHLERITYNHTSALPEGHTRAMVFISEDGETTEIKEMTGDSLVWITEKEVDGDHVKVMKYKIQEGEEPHGERVIVIKSKDGDSFNIVVDEDKEGENVVVKKEIRVVVSDDEDVTWDVDHEHDEEVEVKVIKKKEEK